MYEMEGPRRGFSLAVNPIAQVAGTLLNRHHPCLKLSTERPADRAFGLVLQSGLL